MGNEEGTKTVLIVENDQDVREVLQTLVAHMGYHAITADRASQALKVIESTPVDLLLLDIHMPGPHGHHLLTYLKNRKKAVPPTIVVSGYLYKELIPELIHLGVTGIVAKPFSPARLMEEMERAVSGFEQKGRLCCSGCGRPLRAGDLFCRSCGNRVPLDLKCPLCGKELQPGDVFCGSCGRKIE